jgi:hypothetical protein
LLSGSVSGRLLPDLLPDGPGRSGTSGDGTIRTGARPIYLTRYRLGLILELMAFKDVQHLTDPVLANPKRRANVERERQELVAEIVAYNLAELRKAKEVTQVEIAGLLARGQSTVSALEHSEDPKLSTLREYVEALGGRLEIAAVFEDERFELKV